MVEALHAATQGRFLLPAGPLALFLAERVSGAEQVLRGRAASLEGQESGRSIATLDCRMQNGLHSGQEHRYAP